MKTYIGIDVGTSALKLLLVRADGKILASRSETYPVLYPQNGWSEQNPADWLAALKRGMPELLKGQDARSVGGLSFGGQMHGLVVLDKDDNVIRPCILWNDGRTEEQTEYLNTTVGKDVLSRRTANIAFAGFTAPKLLWLKEHEPDNFAKIKRVCLPKDYLVYMLTGTHSTDYSDASGTLLLDVRHKRWSSEMLDLCGIDISQLPRLYESYEPVGPLKPEYVKLWGLCENTAVAAGAGDNAASAIGTGAAEHGDTTISLGTSGTVFIAQDTFGVDSKNALHSFCHANGKYHLMGCILSAAACNSWWMNILNSTDFIGEQAETEELLGKNSVYFLPYLTGERSPHNDVNARGAFIGMSPMTTRKAMTLAVLEGVAFALRDCVEVAKSNGIDIRKTRVCGGGAKSELWCKILANVLGVSIERLAVEHGASYGAAILAMVADGAYKDVSNAVTALVHTNGTINPSPDLTRAYQLKYAAFRAIYPALKDVYKIL
ncbi:MAG: xylulokinase [Clostridiales bacterium]|nr:xylulokinase [Clostridiales bacterium]